LPYIVAKIMNNSVSPKTGFKPQAMVFGLEGGESSFLNLENFSHPHYLVRNNKQRITKLTEEIQSMIAIASEKYTENKLQTLDYQNKNKIEKRFKKNDYVFVVDRMNIPGNTRPLKTKFHPSPYVVVNTRHTTTQVKRLADGFESVYSNNDLKKYDITSPLFAQLPPQISKVLLHDFQNLLESDLCTITKYDKFNGPMGINLFESNNELSLNEEEIDEPNSLISNEKDHSNVEQKLENLSQDMKEKTPIDITINKIKDSLKKKVDLPINPDEVNLDPSSTTQINKRVTRASSKLQEPDKGVQNDKNSDSEDEETKEILNEIPNRTRKVRFQSDDSISQILDI
jgi:hypothetical protein